MKKEGLTLTELAQELEAPKSSLFPIVHTLEERRYLRQNRETGRYTVGSGIWILGAAFAADGGLEPIVEVMKKVVAECQETCQLGLLEKGNVLYVEKEDSPQAIRMISWVGNRLPANATAIGKALLSGLTDAEIRRLYADGLPQLTEHTITDPAVLLAQLAEVRRRDRDRARGIHPPAGLLGGSPAPAGQGVRSAQRLRAPVPLSGGQSRACLPVPAQSAERNRGFGRNMEL